VTPNKDEASFSIEISTCINELSLREVLNTSKDYMALRDGGDSFNSYFPGLGMLFSHFLHATVKYGQVIKPTNCQLCAFSIHRTHASNG